MEYLDITEKKTEMIIQTCLENQTLIPIFGAGYTAGEKSKGGVVPSGDDFKKLMLDAIVNSSPKFKEHLDQLSIREFSQIAELYLNKKIVNPEKIKTDIQNNFHGVDLSKIKKDFLKVKWPYIYTLNIDDAIENNSNFIPVLPYKNISKESRNFGCVYKVHGDATHEIIYNEETSLIFSSSQYVRSLIRNESMLLFLKTDLIENNILFIGCSLRNEIDILHSVIGQDEKPSDASRRIYVTDTKPDLLKELDLETYNINTVIIVPTFDYFYAKIIDIASSVTSNYIDLLEKYSFRKENKLEKSKNINLDFLLKSVSVFEGKPHYVTTPYFSIARNESASIAKSCVNNPVTIVKGRRFSGKTLILLDIANQMSQKHVYYFPSTVTLTEDVIKECLSKENSFMIFDTNVLNYKNASFIRENIDNIRKLNNSLLIACNPTEIDIVNTFSLCFDSDFYFEIENKLDKNETTNLNKKLSELGIINFRSNKTLLDNTFSLAKEYPDRKSKIVDCNELSTNEVKALFIISVFDKIYSSAARAIGMHLDDMKRISNKLHPILELEVADKFELQHHSHSKLTLNSKPWLFQVLSNFNKTKGHKETSLLIKDIVKTFVSNSHFSYIQEKIIMFDSLNQIFSYEEGGAGLIREVYVTIQPLLSDKPDYWLQRAKSILKLENKNIQLLKDGIDYARKAFNDGFRQKTITNAEFTIALLYGKLCKIEEYKDVNNVVEAVEWFHTAITKHKYNKPYVDSMLEHSRKSKGPFHNLCNYLNDGEKNVLLLNLRDKVQNLLHYYSDDMTNQ